ncbi:MAG TPA: phosphatidylglycerol lysyltransferase domain-containing protein [Candidatus Ozemobacteraceae bacterium]|nr:phosphatidylglycerol lysyltransferase domain-containing protein [Candidatus Ozemobacteraceae bacterium]
MNNLLEFPKQQRLACEYAPIIHELLRVKGIHSSDFACYNLMGWYLERPPMVSRFGDQIILDVEGPGGTHLYLPPLGHGSPLPAIQAILRHQAKFGGELSIGYVPEALLAQIKDDPALDRVEEQRDEFDYLYDRHELAELAGRKFHQKKNFVNRVQQSHNPQVEPLTPDNLCQVMTYLDAWYAEHAAHAAVDLSTRLESLAAGRALPNLGHLGGIGLVVRIAGTIEGVTVASPVHDGCWIVTLEKANREIKGLYQFINWSLANHLPDNVKLINRETDLGIEGLRSAKLSYHPVGFEKKYRLYFSETFLRNECSAI